ncbi:MAG: O-antigen ligase [Verrucomicrobiales bacterium]
MPSSSISSNRRPSGWLKQSVPILASITIVVISWGLGGGTEWGSWFVTAMGWACWAAALAVNLQRGGGRWKRSVPFGALPWLALLALGLTSMCNPSFGSPPDAGGEPFLVSIAHVEYLPSTVDGSRTARYLSLLSGLMAYGIALHAWSWQRRSIQRLLQVIFVNGLILAVAGGLTAILGVKSYLGLIDSYEGGHHFATFHYKNNWIGFILPCIATGIALYTYHGRQSLFARRNSGPLYLLALPLMAVTVPLSMSRAGVLLLGILVLWMGLRFVYGRVIHRRQMRLSTTKSTPTSTANALGAMLIVGITVAGSLTIAARQIVLRWQATESQIVEQVSGEKINGRLLLMRDTIKMAQAKPALGWGIGTFGQIFPMYQGSELYRKVTVGGESVWEPRFYEFAHNDYLQFWAESGALGCILLVSVPALLVVSVWRRHHEPHVRHNAVSHWLAVGCVLVLLLALIDFPFGNEAVGVLFVTLFVLSGKFALLAGKGTHLIKSPG